MCMQDDVGVYELSRSCRSPAQELSVLLVGAGVEEGSRQRMQHACFMHVPRARSTAIPGLLWQQLWHCYV